MQAVDFQETYRRGDPPETKELYLTLPTLDTRVILVLEESE